MRRFAALLLVVAACTNTQPRAVQTPSPSRSFSPVPSPSPSPTPVPAFDAARALAQDRIFVERFGPREAASDSFRKAAGYAAGVFASYGYRVVRQAVPVPKGTTEGVPVPAGSSQNVIAYPPGYDPAKPHLVAGAHLDTVPVSPGANDNGSGAAAILELARLASIGGTRLPVVFVEFTGEERRFKGSAGALFGSKRYLASLGRAERASLRGMLNIDMIGNGPVTLVCHSQTGRPRTFLNFVLLTARTLGVPARESIVTHFFSDHVPFEGAGIPVAWLWSGDQSAVHTPRDRMAAIRAADIARSGKLAWEALRTFR